MMWRISSPAFACQSPVSRTGACAATAVTPTAINQRIRAPLPDDSSGRRPSYPGLVRCCASGTVSAYGRDRIGKHRHLPFPLLHHSHERTAQLGVEFDAAALHEVPERLLDGPRLPVR